MLFLPSVNSRVECIAGEGRVEQRGEVRFQIIDRITGSRRNTVDFADRAYVDEAQPEGLIADWLSRRVRVPARARRSKTFLVAVCEPSCSVVVCRQGCLVFGVKVDVA